MVWRGQRFPAFLEQVDYSGRRLAKLNLPPSTVLAVLGEYDRMLEAELPEPSSGFGWLRRQFNACVAITLNNAFYQVREAETSVFYELGRAELEARTRAELAARCEQILTRFCQGQAGRVLLREDGTLGGGERVRRLSRPRYLVRGQPGQQLVLEPQWRRRYAFCWSVPVFFQGRLAAVMQFAFSKEYRWLPGELQLLAAAGERCLLACEKVHLMEELALREAQIRKLAADMLQVEEAERRRISRELHDEAGQLLLYLRLQLEMLERLVPEQHSPVRQGLAGARELLERTIVEIRRLLADLSPAVLEQLGLAAALRQLAHRFRSTHPIEVELRLSRLGALSSRVSNVVYRLVQECLNNVARHSSARRVMISLKRDDTGLKLRVSDDGVGFDIEKALTRQGSYGLAGIRERVALLGGLYEVRSRPGGGTAISVDLPTEG